MNRDTRFSVLPESAFVGIISSEPRTPCEAPAWEFAGVLGSAKLLVRSDLGVDGLWNAIAPTAEASRPLVRIGAAPSNVTFLGSLVCALFAASIVTCAFTTSANSGSRRCGIPTLHEHSCRRDLIWLRLTDGTCTGPRFDGWRAALLHPI